MAITASLLYFWLLHCLLSSSSNRESAVEVFPEPKCPIPVYVSDDVWLAQINALSILACAESQDIFFGGGVFFGRCQMFNINGSNCWVFHSSWLMLSQELVAADCHPVFICLIRILSWAVQDCTTTSVKFSATCKRCHRPFKNYPSQ